MKYLRYAVLILIPVYFMLVCSREPGHDHDRSHGAQSHGEAEHDHERAPDGGEHESPPEAVNGGGQHVRDDQDVHEEDGHTHEDEARLLDHEHDSEGLISVEGDWERLVGLETVRAERRALERVIPVPGRILPNPDLMAVVSPFIDGSVNCVFANVGDRVAQDDELACLSSPEIGMLRAEYDKAKAELEIEEQNYRRRKKLFDDAIISEKTFQEAELARRVAEVNFSYAMKKLLAVGIPQAEIDEPPTGHSEAVGSTIHMHAPISGVITERNASPGQKVDKATHLFEIIDLSRVWCEAAIFEKDLTHVETGQRVRVRVTAYPGRLFSGRIFHVGSTLNPETKTIRVVAEIENTGELLKPGMFADAAIVVGTKADALVVPADAILDDEGLSVVFVKEEGGYHRHVVKLGMASDPDVEIVSGLEAGAVVVTKGNYQLKSKLKMQGVDPHAGHVH